MNHALGNEVVEFNAEFDKFSSNIKNLVDEVKEDVQKTLDEFREAQSSQTERVDKVEDTIHNEVQNIKDLFKELEEKFDLFKQETANVIENSVPTDNTGTDRPDVSFLSGPSFVTRRDPGLSGRIPPKQRRCAT